MTAEKFDVYTHVTNQIIAQIETGTPPWRKPWTGSGASVSLPERFNGEAYRGINILMPDAPVQGRSPRRSSTVSTSRRCAASLSTNRAPCNKDRAPPSPLRGRLRRLSTGMIAGGPR